MLAFIIQIQYFVFFITKLYLGDDTWESAAFISISPVYFPKSEKWFLEHRTRKELSVKLTFGTDVF